MDDAVKSKFDPLLKQTPVAVQEILDQIRADAANPETAKSASEAVAYVTEKLRAAGDFDAFYAVLRDRCHATVAGLALSGASIGAELRKLCKDRAVRAILETANFGGHEVAGRVVAASVKGAVPVKAAESFRRFDVLRALKVGDKVIDKAWGFGVIKRIDSFYRRVIVDFNDAPNHEISFATACMTISPASPLHFWTILHDNPVKVYEKLKTSEGCGDLVKILLRSFGPMPVQRLQERLMASKLLGSDAEWRAFWEKARSALREDARVKIPTRRTDCITISAEAETYGDDYFARLAKVRDPNQIFAAIGELDSRKKLEGMTDSQKAILGERLAFALKGAAHVNMPLYARVAVAIRRLGFTEPSAQEMREALWFDNVYLPAAVRLSARDTEGLVDLLLEQGPEAEQRLIAALSYQNEEATEDEPPHYTPCSVLFSDILDKLKDNPACEDACFILMNKPKAPHALVGWLFRHRKNCGWKKQIPFIRLIDHALAIVENTASGDALHVQNDLRKTIDSAKWWQETCQELSAVERRLLFERIQSSAQLESALQRKLLTYMIAADEELKKYRKVAAQHDKAQVRLTSVHSMAERQLMFKRLVEIEIPENRKAIQEAKEKGDLSENAEYQYAKDKERELLQRQAELNAEIKKVKETDFANMPTDHIGQGVTFVLALADGSELSHTILGEWDYDEQLGIISNKAKLAEAVDGAKIGDTVKIPRPDGEASATVKAILPLSEAIRSWIVSLPQENE